MRSEAGVHFECMSRPPANPCGRMPGKQRPSPEKALTAPSTKCVCDNRVEDDSPVFSQGRGLRRLRPQPAREARARPNHRKFPAASASVAQNQWTQWHGCACTSSRPCASSCERQQGEKLIFEPPPLSRLPAHRDKAPRSFADRVQSVSTPAPPARPIRSHRAVPFCAVMSVTPEAC